jgi:hypothetical protein
MDNGEELEAVRRRIGIDLDRLWVGYFGLGGTESQRAVEAYLRGERPVRRIEHDVLAQAINEDAVDRGEDHPAPYSEDVQSSDGRGGG